MKTRSLRNHPGGPWCPPLDRHRLIDHICFTPQGARLTGRVLQSWSSDVFRLAMAPIPGLDWASPQVEEAVGRLIREDT